MQGFMRLCRGCLEVYVGFYEAMQGPLKGYVGFHKAMQGLLRGYVGFWINFQCFSVYMCIHMDMYIGRAPSKTRAKSTTDLPKINFVRSLQCFCDFFGGWAVRCVTFYFAYGFPHETYRKIKQKSTKIIYFIGFCLFLFFVCYFLLYFPRVL